MEKKTVEKHFIDFDIYLDWVGAEKKPKTNPYEAFRFIANEIVCVIYNNKKGQFSYSNEEAHKVYYSFLDKKKINVSGTARQRFDTKMKENIIARDGLCCFYTAVTLKPENMSIEHLIPVSKGGKNNLDNLVLCTQESNAFMADKPLIEKLKIRDEITKGNNKIIAGL